MTEPNGALKYRMQALEDRMKSSEADRADIWRHQGQMEKGLAVIDARLKNIEDDNSSIKKWLAAAALGSFGLVISIAALITQGGLS